MEKIKGLKKYKLELVVFVCGAMTMVLELVAARVLSPYVGSSNLIWTSIIGIMLVFMSLGYLAGGKIADKKHDINDLSQFILISAITTSIIPILETIIVNNLAQVIEQLIIVAIISAIFIFGIPSFMLATASPIAVKLKNEEEKKVGSVSGKISSLSTIGSIFGTFFAGFVLIPNVGVSNIIIGSSILLLMLSILIHQKKDKKYVISMIIVTLVIILLCLTGKNLFKIAHLDVIKDEDSEYSRIWVKDIKVADNVSYKTLQVDTELESYMNEQTGEMGAKYLGYYDLFEYYNKNAKDALLIGGAAYTYPKHYLKRYDDKKIDVVEIDPKMTQIAEEEFDLDVNNPNLGIYHQDGRSYLNYSKNKYDVIMIDAFTGRNVPFELTTYEAMSNAKRMLNEGGIVMTNVISSLEGKDSKFIKHEYATYKKVFDDVKLFMVNTQDKNQVQNLILIGIKGESNIDKSKEEKYQVLLETEVKDFESDSQISTDDFAPIGS